jgi:hypothetical protein
LWGEAVRENPKHEIRNPKQYQNSKVKSQKTNKNKNLKIPKRRKDGGQKRVAHPTRSWMEFQKEKNYGWTGPSPPRG